MIWLDSHHANTMTISRPAMFMGILDTDAGGRSVRGCSDSHADSVQ